MIGLGIETNLQSTFTCLKCKRTIGIFQDDLLLIDGLIVKELHAVCANCGHELHYTLSGRKFERLVEEMTDKIDYPTTF
jgi:DNA-directed RNA polymerase subunit RPC12/RpoP